MTIKRNYQQNFQGPAIVGPPATHNPYYSHTIPIRIPWSMGMIWEAYGNGVPLLRVCGKIPKITMEFFLGIAQDLQKYLRHLRWTFYNKIDRRFDLYIVFFCSCGGIWLGANIHFYYSCLSSTSSCKNSGKPLMATSWDSAASVRPIPSRTSIFLFQRWSSTVPMLEQFTLKAPWNGICGRCLGGGFKHFLFSPLVGKWWIEGCILMDG